MRGRRVAITGLGLLTSLGRDVPTTWRSLCEGKSGITHITLFDAGVIGGRIQINGKDDNAVGVDHSAIPPDNL